MAPFARYLETLAGLALPQYFSPTITTGAMAQAPTQFTVLSVNFMSSVVSSAANMDRLEEIRTDNLRRTGLIDGAPDEDAVAMVWLSYNVHGNESVSTEAAIWPC